MSSTATSTTLALKEWGAVVHALLQGRQTVLLRKGGIHEKAFTVDGAREPFVVFPTVAHSHAERVRREHADLLAPGAADVAESAFVIRCGLRIVDRVEVTRSDGVPAISDLHIWTDDSVAQDRIAFRPRHPLQVLVVQAVELPEPVVLPRVDSYGGCRSWLDLPPVWDGTGGRAVHDVAHLEAVADRVRTALT